MEYDIPTSAKLIVQEHLMRTLLVAYLVRKTDPQIVGFREWVKDGLSTMNVGEEIPPDAPALEIQAEALLEFQRLWERMLPALLAQRLDTPGP